MPAAIAEAALSAPVGTITSSDATGVNGTIAFFFSSICVNHCYLCVHEASAWFFCVNQPIKLGISSKAPPPAQRFSADPDLPSGDTP